jgi:hypothetical protein
VAFRRESDLVELLSSRIEAVVGCGRHTFVQAEWGLGPRIADLVVAVFDSCPRPSRELTNLARISLLEARVAAELLTRPLRSATVGERLRLEVDVAKAALSNLEKLGLASSERGAWSVTKWARCIPSEIVVFEAKLVDWRSAVAQAEYYRSFADRAYVAMPSTMTTEDHLRPACRKAGVGLVALEPTGGTEVVSRASARSPSPARRRAFAVEVLRRYATEAR